MLLGNTSRAQNARMFTSWVLKVSPAVGRDRNLFSLFLAFSKRSYALVLYQRFPEKELEFSFFFVYFVYSVSLVSFFFNSHISTVIRTFFLKIRISEALNLVCLLFREIMLIIDKRARNSSKTENQNKLFCQIPLTDHTRSVENKRE